MKHLRHTLFPLLLLSAALGQNIDTLPTILGSAVDKANDKILVRDASVSAAAGALRAITLAEVANIPGMFSTLEPALGNPATNGYLLSSTTAGVRSWIAPPTSVTNAAVVAAIATDPAAIRTAAGTARIFNVKDYGAIGNGIADDTVAIQAVMNALKLAGGGVAYLPKGVYRVNKTADLAIGDGKHAITLYSNISVIGDGPYLTIIKPLDSAQGNLPILYGYPVGGDTEIKNVQIRDLQIDGNKSRGGGVMGEDEGINFYGGNNILLDNLVIHSNGQDGFDLDNYTAGPSKNITVTNCRFYENGGAAIHPEIENMIVANCHFEENGHARALDANPLVAAYACAVDATGDNFAISNCTFKNNHVDILANNATISNCTFLNSSGRTPIKQNAAGTNNISNCRITALGSGSIGIEINAANSFNFISNTTINAQGAGIKQTTGGDLLIAGNTISGGVYGVQVLNQNSKRVSITDNRFSSVSTTMIRIESAGGGQAIGNYSDQAAGVLIDLRSSTSNWLVASNYGSGTATGVRCFSGVSNTIRDNHFVGGLDIQTASNRIISNRFGTLAINAGGTSNLFENNEITGTITHTTATYNSNTWRGNTGAGVAGIFSGTVGPLTSGGGTIISAAVSANSKLILTLKTVGGTIAGQPYVATITPGTGLTLDGGGASNTSVYNWSITD